MQQLETGAVNSDCRAPISPLAALSSALANRQLIAALVKRDFIGRYKGSIMGVAWSMLNPLLMLTIYTFVFSVAFKVRWGADVDSKTSFAIVLFSGVIVHGLLSECLTRAPMLIVEQANYVKKVVFPLEILPLVVLLSAILHFMVSFGILLLACLVVGNGLRPGISLVPVILFPLMLFSLGVSWILASLGVYLRDLAQGMGIVATMLLFVSPVFYPIEALPEEYRWIVQLNPLTTPITQMREAVLWGGGIDWAAWTTSLALGLAVCCAGFWWFQRSRRGFADVL